MASEAAAKEGDSVVGTDTHIVLVPSPGGPVPTPMPFPFQGKLSDSLSGSIYIGNERAAVEGSVAKNDPEHIPSGGTFQKQPANKGTVKAGSSTVFFDGKGAASNGGTVETCADPSDAPNGAIVSSGTVFVGT